MMFAIVRRWSTINGQKDSTLPLLEGFRKGFKRHSRRAWRFIAADTDTKHRAESASSHINKIWRMTADERTEC